MSLVPSSFDLTFRKQHGKRRRRKEEIRQTESGTDWMARKGRHTQHTKSAQNKFPRE